MFQFENENLELPYECEMCDCAETPEKDAPACNRKGNLVCGACQCQDGWKGINNIPNIFLLSLVIRLPLKQS